MFFVCAVCHQEAREARFVPTGYLPGVDAGWCCTECWCEHWKPHWPVWSTLRESESVIPRTGQWRQLDLFPWKDKD